jgi:Cu/Zn superoxide dismutase
MIYLTDTLETLESIYYSIKCSFYADEWGNIDAVVNDSVASLYRTHSIVGHGLVLHEKSDDLGRPFTLMNYTGNAGSKIACGIIGIY